MKFTNECPIHLIELTRDNASLVKVPPSWMSRGEQDVCYFISEEGLLPLKQCFMTRRSGYYFTIKLSELTKDELKKLCSNDTEPYDLETDRQKLIMRTANFPWELRRFPDHQCVARSKVNPAVHAFSTSLLFSTVGLLSILMIPPTLDEDVVENNRVSLFAFVLLMTITGGAAEYCLRNMSYNSSGLFSEGLKLLRSIPPSGEPHRHIQTQTL